MSPELTRRPEWLALQQHFAEIGSLHLRDLFAADPARGERFSAEAAGLYLDYSRRPGEWLQRDAQHRFSCDGRSLGQALTTDSQGQPLPRFTHNGPVPEGQLFLVGTHPRSYDSRYFGFVDAREILHQALPLW